MCSNFPTTTNTFLGLSGDCCNKRNCSKRFYLYTKTERKLLKKPPQTTRLGTATSPSSMKIFWIHFLSLYFKARKSTLKNVYLLYTYLYRKVHTTLYFYCRINSAKRKKVTSSREKLFPFIHV